MAKVKSITSYFGGKNGEIGEWIANQLPYEKNGGYAEPFCGMLGVLLHRPPVKTEIMNDLNNHIVDMWRAVRDFPDELQHMFACTPRSRDLYREAVTTLQMTRSAVPLVKRGWAVATICHYSRLHTTNSKPGDYVTGFVETRTITHKSDYIPSLCNRLRMVQLECTDAVKLCEKLSDHEHFVVYIDPPYPNAEYSTNYGIEHNDEKLIAVMREMKCRVAVSGYGDQYDCLGWQRSEFQTVSPTGKDRPERTEVLWCNFEPVNNSKQMEFDL